MVKEKFDSITKDRLKIKKEINKDSTITDTKDETTKIPHEEVKKPKKNKIKHKKAKRFSVVTEYTTDKFYDSEEIYNINDRKTTKVTKKKGKGKNKRKHKKNTKSTARSRFMTLYVEEYTGKVKKIRTREKTAKYKHNTWKDKTKKTRSKNKKEKTKYNTHTDSDEYNKKTTTAKRYKDLRNEKPTKHHKKSKKYSKRSETTKKSRKWLRLPRESYEGISIESFETKSYRKNIDFDEFQNRTANIQNITKSTILNTATERIEVTATTELNTFGTLDFWPGTGLEKSNSQKVLSSKAFGNVTTTPKPLLKSIENNTFENGEKISKNGTLRLIDLKVNDFEISTKLPTTKNMKKENKLTTKQTKTTQKQKVTTKKTKLPLMIRRSIGTSVKNKITTVKKTTTATKITNTTISTNVTKPIFNLGEYLNQSEILNTADREKKDKIQEKILKDMQLIFSPTATTTKATKVFTDPFNEIDKAFDV
ncbi:uncharacterized protein LOC119189365 [Manduca sexta]|uniref:uncharacterized protein LOC119189365 n=1 Tax=Manduca sexta TaxID=7130 RepID=UPI00188F19E3|nr:uncharacterized protein LOC119189365 [Manduca sexta]